MFQNSQRIFKRETETEAPILGNENNAKKSVPQKSRTETDFRLKIRLGFDSCRCTVNYYLAQTKHTTNQFDIG
jgi:hypothetical protein